MRNLVTVFAVLLSLVPGLAAGEQNNPPHLRQRNPVKEAPPAINTTDPNIWDAYPWFSRDGKLLFWTRETNGIARVWVTYFRNRAAVINTSVNQSLPALDISTPWVLPGAWNNGTQAAQTVKAYAYCHQAYNEDTPSTGFEEYIFTLFYSSGVEGARVMYRIPNLKVRINETQGTIVYVEAPSAPQVMGSGVNASGANATEPMLTRDGRFLFWASNAPGFSPLARYIEVSQACTQLNEASVQYSQLPSSRFAWVDQYTAGQNWDRTRSTNYHSVLEKGSIDNSQTALIFERCNQLQRRDCGGHQCDCVEDPLSRYCDCVSVDDPSVPLAERFGVLMSTGFQAGKEPAPILGCTSSPLNQDYPGRDTHPAVSGPPTLGGTWLLFFMRGKKIWYTNISECPASGACTC